MSVLVLGGSGFLGSAVARSLSERGLETRIICRVRPDPALFGTVPISVTTTDFASLTASDPVFDGVEAVLHFISTTTPASSMADMAFDVTSNLLPTVNLLKIMKRRRIPRLIFASSGGTVYGVPVKLPVAEDDPTDPISAHGITKLMIEKFINLHARQSGLDAVILRIGNPFGPFQLRGVTIGSIARFVRLHSENKTIHIWGNGNVVRDYFYITDLCDAITQIVQNKEFPSGVSNLGAGSGHSLLDVIDQITEISGRPPRTSFEAGRSIDVPSIVLETTRLRTALPDWQPRISFSDGIQRMWRVAQERLTCRRSLRNNYRLPFRGA